MKRYANTADYIEKALLGKPDGYPVWLTYSDCTYIYNLLEEAMNDGDEKALALYHRFGTQYRQPKDVN